MRERGILMTAPNVRSILAGTKTQTRRVWKMPRGCDWYSEMGGEQAGWFVDHGQPWWLHVTESRCPYGHPGDRLWCRESFSYTRNDAQGFTDSGEVWYWADGNPQDGDWSKPRPSIHMPRWASRITLEITDVRVERLQEISRDDAIAEGCDNDPGVESGEREGCLYDPRDLYCSLWESINGRGSWELNPWVWVISFRRIGDA